jgi:hypothetical protein
MYNICLWHSQCLYLGEIIIFMQNAVLGEINVGGQSYDFLIYSYNASVVVGYTECFSK